MKYKAIIWGIGSVYRDFSESIFKEVALGRLDVVGVTGAETRFKSIDGLPFIKKSEIKDTNFDIIIVAASNSVLPDIYHEALELGIEREKFIRADVFSLPNFNIEKYMSLRKNPVTIISDGCFAGLLYHRLNLRFTSPTINLFFHNDGFKKFCNAIPEYAKQELVLDEMRYGGATPSHYYPIGRLNDIKLFFNHYPTMGEAVEKWKNRCKLINYNNIIVVMRAETEDMLDGFENIPYRKYCFAPFKSNAPDTYYLPLEKDKELWQMVNNSSIGLYPTIDPLKLLLGEENFMRCEFA